MKNKLKIFFLPIIIFLLSFFIRTWQLNLFPVAMVHDELNYVMNAKSLYETGKNIPLTASSLFSWGENNWDVVISEIPSYLVLPWVGPNEMNQFNARVVYALVSSLSVVVLYFIAEKLLNKEIALFAGIAMALNPWSIHFGRTSLEVNFATFFFLLGILVYLKNQSWKIFWSLPFFVASFMSYLGAKLHFLPIIIFLTFFKLSFDKIKKEKIITLSFLGISLLLFLAYFVTMKYQPAGARRGELIPFETEWTSSIVNDERRQAIPNSGLSLFSNKATVALKRIADVYISGFSTVPLFVRGDVVSIYSLWQHGQFYYLDFFLISLGIVVLFTLEKKVFWLVSAIILLGPTVSSIDLVEQTYPVRSFPMFPFLCLLIGIGFWFIFRKLKYGKIILGGVGIIYLILVLNFLNLYFYRYPVYSAERWFLSERILSKYLTYLNSDQDKSVKNVWVVVEENPKNVFEDYLFYSGKYNSKEDVILANQKLTQKDFSDGKITFVSECPSENLQKGDIVISDQRKKCLSEKSGERGIVSLTDSGTVFIINNDYVCSGLDLRRYYQPTGYKEFFIEKQNKEEFCQNWIISF